MPRGRPRGSAATASAAAPTRTRRARNAPTVEFTQSLVLNQWLFGLFGLFFAIRQAMLTKAFRFFANRGNNLTQPLA